VHFSENNAIHKITQCEQNDEWRMLKQTVSKNTLGLKELNELRIMYTKKL